MRKNQIQNAGVWLGLAYLVVETYRYIQFIRTRNMLRNSKTPLSRDFSHDEWFDFYIKRIKQNPHTFAKMIEYIFGNRIYETIDRASIKACLMTLASGSEIHNWDWFIGDKQQMEIYKNTVCDIVAKNTPHNPETSDKHMSNFIRINDPHTNMWQSIPLFRPLPLALAFRGLRYYGNRYLYNNGYRRQTSDNGFVFWIKETKRRGTTLCFLHGLGFGAIPYLATIMGIAKQMNYDNVIFVEMPGISGNLYPKTKITAQETAITVCGVIRTYPNIDVIAHSYGTCVLTYIENRYPTFFRKSVYIDPICFFPVNTKYWPIAFKSYKWSDILYCKTKTDIISVICFSEQYHSHLIHNSVYVYEFVNREKKMTSDTMILLGGNDNMVPSLELYEYVQTNYPDVILHYFEKDKHGAFISKRNQHYYNAIRQFLGVGKPRFAIKPSVSNYQ